VPSSLSGGKTGTERAQNMRIFGHLFVDFVHFILFRGNKSVKIRV
jgi:hypothetical protein